MTPLENILKWAKQSPRRIVLPEGEDWRIVEGACRAAKDGIAKPVLLGTKEKVEALVQAQSAADLVDIVDHTNSPELPGYIDAFHKLRAHKGVDHAAAAKALMDPINYGAMMVRQGDAAGSIAGAVATTADTVRAALQIIGRAPGTKMVSSFFLMLLCEEHHQPKGGLVFSDCGLVIDPDPEEMAEIAVASADSFSALVGEEPRVAMLSFSTKGSGRHDRVTKVEQATQLVQTKRPSLKVDGELQFDSAFVPSVAAGKAPGSPVAGQANVFVFPSLEAANIGYKIAERIGGAKAIGPVLQGLAQPANDLSRGCSVDDVYHLIAVTSLQAAASSA